MCCTCTVEASCGKPLVVNGVQDTCKAAQPLLQPPHRDASVCVLSAAAIFRTPLEWDIAHIVTEDEEAVGEMFGMFRPGDVPRFPTSQHATAAEALHPVAHAEVVEAGLCQISGSHGSSRGPRREGLKPGLLTSHVRGHRVGELIDHLSCPQAILHVFRFFAGRGAVGHPVFTSEVEVGAVGADEKAA